MRTPKIHVGIALLPLALLAACGSRNDDAGAISPEEDRMLNEAAAALDFNAATAPNNSAIANTTDTGNTQ